MRHPFGGPGRGQHRDLQADHAFHQRDHPRDRLENLLFE